VSSEGHPQQSPPMMARDRALIGGLCEDTAPQRIPGRLTGALLHPRENELHREIRDIPQLYVSAGAVPYRPKRTANDLVAP
jgi:hypothetical protein